MASRVIRAGIWVVVLALGVGLAWWGGAEVGNLLDSPKREEFLSRRAQNTQEVLKQMNSIKVGDTLPDYRFFENLESELITLSEIVKTPTWLTFMEPDCAACLEELEGLGRGINDFPIILVSSSNPLDLMDLREHYGLTIPILHDRNSTYIEAIKVFTFPFNVQIDSNLVIRSIVAGAISKDELRAK